jgi:hypothetical protein
LNIFECEGYLSADADQRALKACPWLFAFTAVCLASLVLLKSPFTRKLSYLWISLGVVIIFALTLGISYAFVVPYIRLKIIASQIDGRCGVPA